MQLSMGLTEMLNRKKWIIPAIFVSMCIFFVATIVVIEVRHFDNMPANFAFSIGGELFSIMVSVVLVASILPAYRRQSGYVRIFVTMLAIGVFVQFCDTLQMTIDGIPELATLNKVVCIFVFMSEIAFTLFFWIYITYLLKLKQKSMNVLSAVASCLFLVFSLLPFVNFFYPLYFTIDSSGVYHRNPQTWWICRIYIVLIVIFVIVALFVSKEKKRPKIIVIIFMGLPLIAVGSGGFQYGVSILYSSMTVSLVLMYSLLFSDNERHLYSKNKELGLATSIQKHMLPSIFPAFPERQEFDIHASMTPAKEVGGDFYDFFLIDDTHLGLVIADVSDKGVPAALFMMASKIMVQNFALLGFSPKEVISRVNRQICMNNQDMMFVTIWLGVLDLETGDLVATNAGHEKPIIKKPDGHFEILNDKHNLVVGSFDNSPYSEYHLHLEKGSKLFVYTDGIPECMNDQGQFGMERTLETLRKYEDLPAREITENVLKDLTSFRGSHDQFDDITMLCIEYRGPASHKKHVTIPADIKKIPEAISPILEALEKAGADHKAAYKIEMALDELLTNVASYAYGQGSGNIDIDYEVSEDPKAITISIVDSGKAFNPLEAEDPDITTPLAERRAGGLGLFIVKKTMDEIDYKRENGKNVLTFKKTIE